MVQIPGEDDLHKFLKSHHLVMVRVRTPFGYACRIVHQPPKLPVHSELGVIQISKSEQENPEELAGIIQRKIESLIAPYKDEL